MSVLLVNALQELCSHADSSTEGSDARSGLTWPLFVTTVQGHGGEAAAIDQENVAIIVMAVESAAFG